MPPYGTEKVSQGTSTRAEIYYLKKSLTQEKDLAAYFNVLIDALKYIYYQNEAKKCVKIIDKGGRAVV